MRISILCFLVLLPVNFAFAGQTYKGEPRSQAGVRGQVMALDTSTPTPVAPKQAKKPPLDLSTWRPVDQPTQTRKPPLDFSTWRPVDQPAQKPKKTEDRYNNKTYNDTKAGTKCEMDSLDQLVCEYRVGKDLYIAIPGIGMKDTAVTIFKSDWNGDYYASFGMRHLCLVVKPGKTTRKRTGFAFISPKNGKVYSNWPSCESGE